MNAQEQEHRDHEAGAQSELLNCLAEDRQSLSLPRLPDPIRELAAAWANRPQTDDCPF